MCTRVGEVRAALAEIVASLDADAVAPADAPRLWRSFDGIERLAGAAKLLLARRVEESREWQRNGHRSPEEHLAKRSGCSVGAARRQLETSKKLQDAPATEAALRSGQLSETQASTIAPAAAADPSAEQRLLDGAKTMSTSELKAEAARVRAAADPDPDTTHRRIRAGRFLRTYTDPEGAWNLLARGTPDDGARIMSALEPLIDARFRQAREAGEHESRESYAFDALAALAVRPADCGDASATSTPRPKPKPRFLALLRADLSALVRGAVVDGERCEIDGIGPVPVSVARQALGEAVLKLVLTNGVAVANVTHLGRGPSAAQRIALLWSSPGCSVQGCNGVRTEVDHRVPFAQTRHTRVDELDPLCPFHHDLKTYADWALVEGEGKCPLVPPWDQRHPRNKASPMAACG